MTAPPCPQAALGSLRYCAPQKMFCPVERSLTPSESISTAPHNYCHDGESRAGSEKWGTDSTFPCLSILPITSRSFLIHGYWCRHFLGRATSAAGRPLIIGT